MLVKKGMYPMTRQQAVMRFLDDMADYQLHGFRLSLHGETLAEGYWRPFTAERPHRMYSVSKSAVSLAIGLLWGDGALGLDDDIVDYFPAWVTADTHPFLRQVTIRQMLSMATCYDRSMYTPLEDRDWTRPFFFGKPTHVPGTLFNYDTSASQVLCALVEKRCGTDILTFLKGRLFDRLGMDGPMRWLKDGVGVSQGGTGLIMTLRDLSRLAEFCMSDGRGLIREDYLRMATGWQIATGERSGPEERHGYGYQFWRMRRGFAMYGLGGQMALCLPEEGLTLCTTADMILDSTGVQPIYDAFFRHLSGIGALPSDPADAEALRERLAGLALRPVGGDVAGPRSLRLVDSPLAFDALTIGRDEVRLRVNGQLCTLPFRPDGWCWGAFPALGETCLASGGWTAENRFTLACELAGDNSCGLRLHAAFRDGCGSVRVTGGLWECAPGWQGIAWGEEEEWT